MFSLKRTAPDPSQSWTLSDGRYTIGRSDDCHIQINEPTISRHHAHIDVAGDQVSVEDLASRNGLFVNGKRLTKGMLRPGDCLGVGSIELTLTETTSLKDSFPEDTESQETQIHAGILERGKLSTSPLLDTERLEVLYAIVDTLVTNLRMEEILPAVLETLNRLFIYDRCAIAGRDGSGGLETWASRPPDVGTPYSRSIVERVLERGEALLYDDIQGQVPFDLGESVAGLNIRSVLCSPLIFRGEIKGLVYLDRSVSGAYSMDDLALLRSVSHLIAIALENARLYAELQDRYHKKADELRKVQSRLIESERSAALGRLAQVIAHEIRNPMMVIGCMTRRLSENLSDPGHVRDTQTILLQADRLERMMRRVDVLINLPEPRLEVTSLEATVQGAIDQTIPFLDQRKVKVKTCSSLLSRPIPHDPGLTQTALEAVLQNAAEMLPSEGIVFITILEIQRGWAIEVSDSPHEETGAEYKGIYDPFFSTHPWAVGLGFTVAQKAMTKQGGDLRIGTGHDHGNRVRLVLTKHPLTEARSP